MLKSPTSLRTILTVVVMGVSLLAVLASAALVSSSSVLKQTLTDKRATLASVRLIEEAEFSLLLHERARDPLVKRRMERDVREKLAEAGRFASSDASRRALRTAESHAERYFQISNDPQPKKGTVIARRQQAHRAIDTLVRDYVTESNQPEVAPAPWERAGNVLGVGVAASVLLITSLMLFWLRKRAFSPIFELEATMERFARGEHDARVEEHGPRELRAICKRFNEMASAVALQRRAQLAFLGGIAHDLRSPLSVLRLGAMLLEQDTNLSADPRARSTLERMDRQMKCMERMLGDFLDGSRIESGQLELRLGVHDLCQLVRDAVELFESGADWHRWLELRLPEQPCSIRCDRLRMEQVVTNLISNALKYSPPSSVVEVALEERGSELSLAVTDAGVGISEADQARLFEPFQRVGLSKETVPGVGLGLFVVHEIVKAHGGRIEVESRLGRGSTFRVLLPALAAGASASRAPVAQGVHLLADDVADEAHDRAHLGR